MPPNIFLLIITCTSIGASIGAIIGFVVGRYKKELKEL